MNVVAKKRVKLFSSFNNCTGGFGVKSFAYIYLLISAHGPLQRIKITLSLILEGTQVKHLKLLYLSIIFAHFILLRIRRELEFIPAGSTLEVGATLDTLPAYYNGIVTHCQN